MLARHFNGYSEKPLSLSMVEMRPTKKNIISGQLMGFLRSSIGTEESTNTCPFVGRID